MINEIIKRDGRIVKFEQDKIQKAISKAAKAANYEINTTDIMNEVVENICGQFSGVNPSVEDIQDEIERVLIKHDYAEIAKAYILYRRERSRIREAKSRLMSTIKEITFSDASNNDVKRENANIDGDTAMGTMLKYGSETAKDFYLNNIISKDIAKAHNEGDIHIHDLDFYTLTLTCCQIDLVKLFQGGFSTGHGFLREPNDIRSYAALACIAIQANQNDMHGGQSVPNFDYSMAIGVRKSYKKLFRNNLFKICNFFDEGFGKQDAQDLIDTIEKETGLFPLYHEDRFEVELIKRLNTNFSGAEKIVSNVKRNAEKDIEDATYQAMEAVLHNLNTMHSRAGAQVPFSSLNYGTDTSHEGRLVMKMLLKATEAGLGNGETPIFPIQIFKVKDGVSYKKGDPNYDLFKEALTCSAKRLFPNFSFLDAPFNLQYYKPGDYNSEVAYMGCRTRVMGNIYDPKQEVTCGRGNLSFTSINLPRLGIVSKSVEDFYKRLDKTIDLCIRQLLDRFDIQSHKKVYNFPFLMGEGVWLDSDKLKPTDEIKDVIKHGTLSVGFIGLAECLKALIGKHHGESPEAQKLGLEIVSHMRERMDQASVKYQLNFSLLATPAEGLSGRFVRLDKKLYGNIPGVTDQDFYTNSFHIPVYYGVSMFKKIDLEAPYHAFTNAGHISYVEVDGDIAKNTIAFEKIIVHMKEKGIGYGSVNHPLDRDPVCGYSGIVDNFCPKCGRKETADSKFERIRRITGYLVGTLDRFNDAKRAEVNHRVKHNRYED